MFIQKYLFRELLTPTLAATAALGAVAVLSQSLGLLSLMVSQRQAAWTFLQLVLLSIPGLVAFVLPITAFVATLYTVNKLHTEQEIVVCFAAGMSRWQVASPPLRLASMAGVLMLVISLWIAPACARVAREALFHAKTDLVGSLVHEGQFTESAGGLTVYAQRVDADGVLHNLFIHQAHTDKGSATYDARTGVIAKRNGAPILIMRNGSNAQFTQAGVLNYLRFSEYTLDLSPYVNMSDALAYKASDMYMHELLAPDPHVRLAKSQRRKMMAEANARLAAPLYVPTFVLFALLAVIGGGFSRMGYGRRIAVAAIAALVVRLAGVTMQAISEGAQVLNALQYLTPVLPGLWAGRRLLLGPKAATAQAPMGRTLTPVGA